MSILRVVRTKHCAVYSVQYLTALSVHSSLLYRPHFQSPCSARYYSQTNDGNNRKDVYKILECTPSSSPKEIKSNFYRLSKLYHPDTSKETNAHEKFIELGEAYRIVSNPTLRSNYDSVQQTQTPIAKQWASRRYRESLNPEDYILYRRPNATHHGSRFNYKEHQRMHYECILD
jgi:curved DNA-binding protein CbpA